MLARLRRANIIKMYANNITVKLLKMSYQKLHILDYSTYLFSLLTILFDIFFSTI